MEGRLPRLHGDDATEIPGARSLLDEIGHRNVPWAIVTSGTEPLVSGWLERLRLPAPEHLITAESVSNGKPDPACYLLGRDRIGLPAAGTDGSSSSSSNVLVLEDSPAGIRAGKAAGCKVLGLVTSHTAEQVRSAEPDWIVRDLDSVKVLGWEDGLLTLEFRDGLVEVGKAERNGAA
ncbi:HAD-like protein [Cryphonectria parasitica EP155]|uniref:HAD-like protein n=1 Tax=Cryphonectria parasitica (strain ATCC 38755 / EP155) TaxID=660469 RepID=A0A9P5CS65_CRYP1|nr:HAD-like protein [Cryphonectria parasitica EP155]KAF3769294.1 HAD-like protein [Cryphonectria parasitica EP155]